MPLIPAGAKPYGFEAVKRGGVVYYEAGYKIGGKKIRMVAIPAGRARRG